MLSCCWKQFYANMDGSVRQGMVLCSWNQIYASDCWQELHFKFSRQNLNRNIQSPPHSLVGSGDDSSHSQGQSGKRLLMASRGRKNHTQDHPISITHWVWALNALYSLPMARHSIFLHFSIFVLLYSWVTCLSFDTKDFRRNIKAKIGLFKQTELVSAPTYIHDKSSNTLVIWDIQI